MLGKELDPVCLIPLRDKHHVISFDNEHPTEFIEGDEYRYSLNAINEADAYRACGDIDTLNSRLQDYKTKYDAADEHTKAFWQTQIDVGQEAIKGHYEAQAALIKKLTRS